MSCIVPDIEQADKNIIRELGVFTNGKGQKYSHRPPISTNPQNKRFGAQETCTELCGTVDVCITVGFQTFLLEL